MKYALMISIVAALVSGCAYGPPRYGEARGVYYQDRNYYQDRGPTRVEVYRDGYRGDRYYGYRQGYDSPANPLREHDR